MLKVQQDLQQLHVTNMQVVMGLVISIVVQDFHTLRIFIKQLHFFHVIIGTKPYQIVKIVLVILVELILTGALFKRTLTLLVGIVLNFLLVVITFRLTLV